MSGSESTRTIRTDFLARVEGEGAMFVQIDGDRVRDVKLRIYEPPRFFEAMLRGRAFTEAPDITSRICGICPIAYQMSAVRAIEDACGVAIDSGPIRDLRRLIYCGEWIESLGLHVYLLHAPDFLGYPGFVEMAREHPQVAERGLQLKKAGNTVMTLVGGREIHPINIRVGGFYRAPPRAELSALIDPLERAREIALATVRWAGELPFPAALAQGRGIVENHAVMLDQLGGMFGAAAPREILSCRAAELNPPVSTTRTNDSIDETRSMACPLYRLSWAIVPRCATHSSRQPSTAAVGSAGPVVFLKMTSSRNRASVAISSSL